MTVSPFDHPLLSVYLGDDETAHYFSLEAELDAMLAFERALAEAEAVEGVISREAADAIGAALDAFAPDFPKLRDGVARDGVVVPELVRQLRSTLPEQHQDSVHFGATSQDTVDTGLMLRLRPMLEMFDDRISALVDFFDAMDDRFGQNMLIGMTRMQAAIPIHVGDRIASWRGPLERHRERLAELSQRLMVVQFGGGAGTLDTLGDKAVAVRQNLAELLALADAPQWHSQRDAIAELAGWFSLVAGSLGKFGQDVALMAQGGAIELSGGDRSSEDESQKREPVAAEAIVALARFNAALLAAMHAALVHEQERSGAAWTLEWLILPQMATATGAALRISAGLADQIDGMGT